MQAVYQEMSGPYAMQIIGSEVRTDEQKLFFAAGQAQYWRGILDAAIEKPGDEWDEQLEPVDEFPRLLALAEEYKGPDSGQATGSGA
jgi:hypothetical protein